MHKMEIIDRLNAPKDLAQAVYCLHQSEVFQSHTSKDATLYEVMSCVVERIEQIEMLAKGEE